MNYPRHIGIIPDGNRTRAAERDLPKIIGHKSGFERAKEIVKYTLGETSVEIVTIRWLSTENARERSPEELSYLFELYQTITDDMKDFFKQYHIGFKRIGSPNGIPEELVQFFYDQEKRYPSKNGKYFILAVNYGWRDEILRGIKKYAEKEWSEEIKNLTEEELSDSMDLWIFPPIELVIRSKGEIAKRISRFNNIVEHRNFWK